MFGLLSTVVALVAADFVSDGTFPGFSGVFETPLGLAIESDPFFAGTSTFAPFTGLGVSYSCLDGCFPTPLATVAPFSLLFFASLTLILLTSSFPSSST